MKKVKDRTKRKRNRLLMLSDLCVKTGVIRKNPRTQYLTKKELIEVVNWAEQVAADHNTL